MTLIPKRPTDAFHASHLLVRRQLADVEALVELVRAPITGDPRGGCSAVLSQIEKTLKGHLEWEERFLYPLIDEAAASELHRYTETMRREHRIMERWIDALAREGVRPVPDRQEFARRTLKLLGLIEAHLEVEETILLPLITAAGRTAQPPPAEEMDVC